jgi:hypothetical protein
MKTRFPRFLSAGLLGAALTVSVAVAPIALSAEEHKTVYHDKKNNDDHEWNNNENQAYKMYAKENHKKASTFSKLKEDDQQAYWAWRHDHSDTVLKINIH